MKARFILAIALAMIVGLGGAVGTARWLEGGAGPALQEDARYLPSPRVARLLSFGYEQMAADLMWIRTVQYFGKHLGAADRFPRLRPLLEVTVGLDPHFVEAYRYGGHFLWIAGDIPATVAFLEEGHQNNPSRWELPHDLGRLYFLQLGDNAKALRWWTITQALPDAPAYLPRFIARLHAKTGDAETALELWQAMEQDPNTHEHWRAIAREEIKRLQAQLGQGQGAR